MKKIISELVDYCFPFTVEFNKDSDIIYSESLDFKVIIIEEDYKVINKGVTTKIKSNSSSEKNVVKLFLKIAEEHLDSL